MANHADRREILTTFGAMVLHDGSAPPERTLLVRATASAGDLALRTLLPETCAGCGLSGTWMCRDCHETLAAIDQQLACPRCGHPHRSSAPECARCSHWNPDLLACRSAFAFRGAARAAVHLLKYRNEPARAVWCARAMSDLLLMREWQVDVFVPVPLHASRVRVRGYNQSEKIAVELSRMTDIPTVAALRRVRSTVSQVGLGAEQRRDNVRGAFSSVGSLAGLTVALIDDVVTTGSTLQESAAACAEAGAISIVAATFAAEVHDSF